MKKGLKIGLIAVGSISLIGLGGFAIYKLTKKEDTSVEGTDDNKIGVGASLEGQKTTGGYFYRDLGKGSEFKPIVGETLYALQDGTIAFRNYADTDSKNYKEWSKSYSKGDAIGVVSDYTNNCIFIDNTTKNMLYKKNAVCVKRGDVNKGMVAGLRDKNGNVASLQEVKAKGISLSNIFDVASAGMEIYDKYQSTMKSADGSINVEEHKLNKIVE